MLHPELLLFGEAEKFDSHREVRSVREIEGGTKVLYPYRIDREGSKDKKKRVGRTAGFGHARDRVSTEKKTGTNQNVVRVPFNFFSLLCLPMGDTHD